MLNRSSTLRGGRGTYVEAIHAKDPGDGDPAGDGAYGKPNGSVSNAGAVYSVVGSTSKNSGGLTQHVVMAYWENYEGSLVIDIDGLQLDGYFIKKDGAVNDHFRIVKEPVSIPALRTSGLGVATLLRLAAAGRPWRYA